MSSHEDVFRNLQALKAKREVLEERGIAALERLVAIACRNTGQPRYVRLFLLGLYNGPEWPLDLTNLRGLDPAIQEDILSVLAMDMAGPRKEVHEYIEDGEEIFQEFWRRESQSD